jgi:hypothetical protein
MKIQFKKVPPGTGYFAGQIANVPNHRAAHFVEKKYAVPVEGGKPAAEEPVKQEINLDKMKVPELQELAKEKGIDIPAALKRKGDIVEYLYQELTEPAKG